MVWTMLTHRTNCREESAGQDRCQQREDSVGRSQGVSSANKWEREQLQGNIMGMRLLGEGGKCYLQAQI